MSRKTESNPCPCGQPLTYDACCGQYVDHPETPAPTAEALMRSRYTAYTLKCSNYLLSTWYPDTRPDQLDLASEDGPVKWLGLDVLSHAAGQPGDQEGTVEFVARFKVNGRAQKLHEISRFVSLDGRWYYVDGDFVS
jgi:SEC-C motif-containing protein